jgi:hypothetical protein
MINLQFVWFLLQLCIMFSFGLLSIFSVLPIDTEDGWWQKTAYKAALNCASVAYGIVLWKRFGRPRFTRQYWTLLFNEESTRYLMVSLIFSLVTSWPFITICAPYAVYAVYHICGYMRNALENDLWVKQRFSEDQMAKMKTQLGMVETTRKGALERVAVIEIFTCPLLIVSLFT